MRAAAFAWVLLLVVPVCGEEARYQVTGEAPIRAAANGYQQEVVRDPGGGFAVRVVTSLNPIESTGSYATVLDSEEQIVPEGFALPQRLAKRLTPDISAWDAATVILEWAANHVVVDSGDLGPQDAASVLARGRGRCSGLANAVVAMLRAAGFEARTVSGLLVSNTEAVPHRWVECRLPGAGWVPTDPTLGLWTVTPRHLVFADTVTTAPEVRVVASEGDGLDRLPRRHGRLVRPNFGANLVCRFPSWESDPTALAVLHGSGGEERRARLDPEATFSGLLPGRWVLEVEVGHEIIERRTLVLSAGGYHTFTVTGRSGRAKARPGS